MEINNTVNPKSALEALYPQSIDCGEGVVVKPFSLATYALLEKIKSYINFPHEPTQEEVLKTLYVCTHDAKETFKKFDLLQDLSIEWAETLRPEMFRKITDAVLKQIEVVKNAMPPEKEGDKKKVVMDS